MAYRDRELVPDNWSLVRERALATGLCSEDGVLNTRVSVEERCSSRTSYSKRTGTVLTIMQQHFSVCKFSCSVSMFGMNCLIGLSNTVQPYLLSKAVSKATFSSSISRSVPWCCATLYSFRSSLKSYLFFQHFSQCALVLCNPFFFQKQSQHRPFLPAFLAEYRLLSLPW